MIAFETPSDRGIAAYLPAHWHARLFEEVIQGRCGQTFSYRRAAAPFLRDTLAEPRSVYRALTAYLVRLRQAGYVAFEATSTGYITSPIRVLADTRHPPPAT